MNLRSAANFAVLAGTALTNNSGGTTLITGDVGSPSQTVDPTLAAGFTNYKSGAILARRLADLQVAITDANSRTCDVSFAGNIDLGGLTLAPGVYCYAGAISITGTLTLNGPGVYIFRTAPDAQYDGQFDRRAERRRRCRRRVSGCRSAPPPWAPTASSRARSWASPPPSRSATTPPC